MTTEVVTTIGKDLFTNNVSPYGAHAGGCNGDWPGDRHISDNLKYP